MGASQSSFTRYKNDFELVIRATKELEYLLETHFGAPDDKQSGLHDKITAARHRGQPLPQQLIKHMRKLVTIRNQLVHERDYNAIPNRAAFAKEFDDIEKELKVMLKNAKNKGGSSCVIC